MPWKLIGALLLLALLVTFIGLNLDNKASVSFGFYMFEDMPVFISLFTAFLCGALLMLPFTLGKNRKSIKKKNKETESEMELEADLSGKKQKGFARKQKSAVEHEE